MTLNEFDREYWADPQNHALLKKKNNDVEYYSMYGIANSRLMMKLCDDMEYAQTLAAKMLENNVRVFDDFQEIREWAREKGVNI